MDANGNVTGWACDPDCRSVDQRPCLRLVDPRAKEKGFPVTANLASEAGVNSRCKGGKAHRFKAAVGTQYRVVKTDLRLRFNLAWTNGWTHAAHQLGQDVLTTYQQRPLSGLTLSMRSDRGPGFAFKVGDETAEPLPSMALCGS
ncbi:MAG: hypothetical protein R3A47_03560 [Polyangiales bacterium]